MRAVLDTNVAVSGICWDGPPARLLELAVLGKLHLSLSPFLLLETNSILHRSLFQGRLRMKQRSVASALNRYLRLVHLVVPTLGPHGRTGILRHNELIDCAVESMADVLISGDHRVLRIGKPAGFQIMNPAQTLHLMGVP